MLINILVILTIILIGMSSVESRIEILYEKVDTFNKRINKLECKVKELEEKNKEE